MVDAGYANTVEFLAPYRNIRYHLSEYRHSRMSHTSPRDLFNHRHAQLRNVVERTFGVWKKRFKVLNGLPSYREKMQCYIVMACAVLHNFIIRHGGMQDRLMDTARSEENDASEDAEDATADEVCSEGTSDGDHLRNGITAQLWAAHNES